MGGISDSGAKWRAVDMGKPASIVGYLKDGTKVKIGGLDNVRRKLAIAGWVWRDAKAKGMTIEYVDVRLPRRPTFMPVGGAAPDTPAGGTSSSGPPRPPETGGSDRGAGKSPAKQ